MQVRTKGPSQRARSRHESLLLLRRDQSDPLQVHGRRPRLLRDEPVLPVLQAAPSAGEAPLGSDLQAFGASSRERRRGKGDQAKQTMNARVGRGASTTSLLSRASSVARDRQTVRRTKGSIGKKRRGGGGDGGGGGGGGKTKRNHKGSQNGKQDASDDDESDDDDDDDTGVVIERTRTNVFFYAPVNAANVHKLIKQLQSAKEDAFRWETGKVTLFLRSDGGDMHAGLSALDHLELLFAPCCGVELWTVADGWLASAGTFLLLGGSRRFGMPNSALLIHSLSTSIEGNAPQIINETSNMRQLSSLVRSMYCSRTKLSKKEVSALMKKESLLTADKAIESGFIEGCMPGAVSGSQKRSKEKKNKMKKALGDGKEKGNREKKKATKMQPESKNTEAYRSSVQSTHIRFK